MRIRVVHQTTYTYVEPVTNSLHELHLVPRSTDSQRCLAHRLEVSPAPDAIYERTDYFDNRTACFDLHEPHQSLRVVATSEVRLEDRSQLTFSPRSRSWQEARAVLAGAKRPDVLAAFELTFPSNYAGVDGDLRTYAEVSFVPGRPLVEATRDLTSRIHADFVYDPTATDVSTPLKQVLVQRRGVCQDFAHLEIACLRSLGLAARYVSGYMLTSPPAGEPRLVGADASHAWVSTYCPDSGWVDFDPANDLVPTDRHVTVAYGRDFGDVTPIRGVILGGGRHALRVAVDVTEVREANR